MMKVSEILLMKSEEILNENTNPDDAYNNFLEIYLLLMKNIFLKN
jgi:hypothetical protein